MKIDVHAHTLKTKSGDSPKRNVDPDSFAEIIKATDVKILAITNHNYFDLEQFEQIVEKTTGICQIWPGVELDVVEEDRRGHILIIVNPENAGVLYERMTSLIEGTKFDKFTITIEDTVKHFDSLDSVFIPHYLTKKPCLIDDDINKMESLISNKNRLIKEATNSISAGIYVSHGHKSIYGSDVHDWSLYTEEAEKLPELRLPVESFNQFCLLLDKNAPSINTLLDLKSKDTIKLEPFGPTESITLDIYNDINILFGSKGTGKTEILRSISDYYNSKGLKTSVFESSRDNLGTMYDIKGNDLNLTLESMNIESCSDEINILKNASEENITSLTNYLRFFSSRINNQRANSIKIKDYPISDLTTISRKFDEVIDTHDKISGLLEYAIDNRILEEILKSELYEELKLILEKVFGAIKSERESRFVNMMSTELYNNLISVFNTEIAKKTGRPAKPTTTGFSKYAGNRVNLEHSVKKIRKSMNKEINSISEYVGDLGVKGDLYCKTDIFTQDGTISNGNYNTLKGTKKTPQKEFANIITKIEERLYSSDLFVELSEFNDINGIEEIVDIDDLLLFHRYFAIDNNLYSPSNGEASMLLLHKELSEDKEIYLLDEPEKSLGNDYINDIIVPLIQERAKLGKKVVIATHDANIAVRTLPYCSVYRKHEITNYSTFIGNPFSDNLIEVNKPDNILNWKEVSMKTLEGGKEAFGERGKIYGN
ncbi:hypothetical protein HYG86_06000 [Alkalicella caledoniensis]|uniref:Uncharacterized protein n=1 Tax=Alkalicella caledoniensis TaxID=2731377 RepID=A0A7G9W6P5_ALKCA|nr:hypothetical protein [Alkalicella caledoniensis]QNO14357.1 hypothetical protein HYG86_06000 [Alkalicella caledoniensis]